MNIILNATFANKEKTTGYDYFLMDLMLRLVEEQTKHHFYLLHNINLSSEWDSFQHLTNVVEPYMTSPFATFANDLKQQAFFRKLKAEVILQLDGRVNSLTNVPQIVFVDTLPKKSRMLKPIFDKSKNVIVPSLQAKQSLASIDFLDQMKIEVLPKKPLNAFQPCSQEEKAEIEEYYLGGFSYILFSSDKVELDAYINMLKAFSQFKKWQLSSMKLVIVVSCFKMQQFLEEKLSSYKYRNDVIVFHNVEEKELVKITKAAYMILMAHDSLGFGNPLNDAIQCGVPVIQLWDTQNSNIDNTWLNVTFNNPAAIADNVLMLYKDEQKHQALATQQINSSQHLQENYYPLVQLWEMINALK